MSYCKDGEIEFEGQKITFTKEEAAQFESAGSYWHAEGDPSTWLVASILREAYQRTKPAPVEFAYALASQVLGISVDAVSRAIEWHENYMRWHDGDDSYSVL